MGSKGKIFIIVIALLTILAIGGCSKNEEPATNTTEISITPAPAENTPMSIYKAVLQDKIPFVSTDLNKDLHLSQIKQAISSDENIKARITKFALVDLENDSIPEVILKLAVNDNEDYGYEVLSYIDGNVYGYTLWYRQFMDIKEDGTFSFSGGASDYGFGRIILSEDGYAIDEITYSETIYDSDNTQNISFYVDKENATQEEFTKAINSQSDKKDVTWYDFTDENMEKILTQ